MHFVKAKSLLTRENGMNIYQRILLSGTGQAFSGSFVQVQAGIWKQL